MCVGGESPSHYYLIFPTYKLIVCDCLHLLVTCMSTDEDIAGGWVAIHGTEMAALHVYLPPSEERTGSKERMRKDLESELEPHPPEPLPLPPEPLPLALQPSSSHGFLLVLLTVILVPFSTTNPFGPTHSTMGSRFTPSITITVQVKV